MKRIANDEDTNKTEETLTINNVSVHFMYERMFECVFFLSFTINYNHSYLRLNIIVIRKKDRNNNNNNSKSQLRCCVFDVVFN